MTAPADTRTTGRTPAGLRKAAKARLGGMWARSGWGLRLGVAVLAGAMVWGLGELGQGVYIKLKAEYAQHLLERAWVRALSGESRPKPWPWADSWPVARISHRQSGRNTVVLAGASGEAMAFAPGLMTGTPMPGLSGTSVIAAHRDTHFAFLAQVASGDVFDVTNADGRTYHFKVTGMEVVSAEASGIEPYSRGSNLALVTCYPFNSREQGPLRYVVHASRF